MLVVREIATAAQRPGPRAGMIADRLSALEELVDGHFW
jgi:hypothetical protein